jgi:hypothetical protein
MRFLRISAPRRNVTHDCLHAGTSCPEFVLLAPSCSPDDACLARTGALACVLVPIALHEEPAAVLALVPDGDEHRSRDGVPSHRHAFAPIGKRSLVMVTA